MRLGMKAEFIILAALMCDATSLKAAPITINFEGFPDSTILTNQYVGVTFSDAIILTAGISLNEFDFPPRSGSNVAGDNNGPLSIDFATPITSFSGYFTYSHALILDAFGAANNLLTSAPSLFSQNFVSSGNPPNELLQVSSTAGISSVTITGDPAGASFVVDDVTYTRMTTAVPEASTLTLVIIATSALFLWCLFTRKRKSRGRHFIVFYAFLSSSSGLATAAPTALNAVRSLPPSITPNAQYTLTLFLTIPSDLTLIPGSVNLIRIFPNNSSVVAGQLHDDGQNGDAIAGDGIYTLQMSVNESAVGQIQLRASAAFLGQLRRVLSPIATIPVNSDAGLPPDPGLAGTLTLAGVDSDNDGVRDDVQRFIALTYPNSARTRAALTDLAKAMQNLLLDSSDAQQSINNSIALNHALECSIAITGLSAATETAKTLRSQVLNTVGRSQAYLIGDGQFSGQFYTLAQTQAQQQALCTFNPDQLPN